MNTLAKFVGATALILGGALASASAMAQYHGHGHGHRHGGNVRFGISLGFPIYAPGHYPAPYYAYPAYAYPAPVYAYPPALATPAPPVYIEQSAAPAVARSQPPADWYYCAAARAYYPYVAECPAGWQRVPAQPSSR